MKQGSRVDEDFQESIAQAACAPQEKNGNRAESMIRRITFVYVRPDCDRDLTHIAMHDRRSSPSAQAQNSIEIQRSLGKTEVWRALCHAYTGEMRMWIAAIGSRPQEGFEDLARIYLERSAGYLPGSGARAGVEARIFRSESAFWTAVERERLRTVPVVVLLDEGGRQLNSEAFAGWIARQRDEGRQLVIFAVGPADGWSDASRARSSLLLSLGPMTLPHELARVVICEQVYRALTILAGHPYHRGAVKRQ